MTEKIHIPAQDTVDEAVSLRHPAAEYLSQLARTREERLRKIIDDNGSNPGNYEYAQDSGLVDIFYYNPMTGEDALVHLLSGDVVNHPNGAIEVGGYHHEPSAHDQSTFVDVEAVSNSQNQKLYRRHSFEPYNAHTVIQGYPKHSIKMQDGKLVENRSHSSMFPNEYDALAVMQTVKLARDNRDKEKDKVGNGRVVTEGSVLLLDGQHTMRVRLVLEENTENVISAFPVISKPGVMKLGEKAIDKFLGIGDN